MPNYKIVESVGSGVQHVHDYEDIERHHPSRGNERGRVYGTVNGEREELLGNYAGTPTVSRDGDYYVSKDFVLQAGNLMQTDQLLAGVVILSLFGLAVGKAINVLEARLLHWR